jgi:hypothetical protein
VKEKNKAKTFLQCIAVTKAEEKVRGFLEVEGHLLEKRVTEGRLMERHLMEDCLAEAFRKNV